MSDARLALRNFYKIADEQAANNSESDKWDNANEGSEGPDDEVLGEYLSIDDPEVDPSAWATEQARTMDLIDLTLLHARLSRERATLASAQRELVNDNYKKLIESAETLGYVSSRGELSELADLGPATQVIAEMVAAEPEVPKADGVARQAFEDRLAEYRKKYNTI